MPKYNGPAEWGGVFAMNPDHKYLSEEEYGEMIEKIKAVWMLSMRKNWIIPYLLFFVK